VPRPLGKTWPLFGEASPEFPTDRAENVTLLHPGTARLSELEQRTDLPETTDRAEAQVQRLRDSVPPPELPDWARAAHALIDWLSAQLEHGADEAAQETLARTWAAFSLCGVSEPQIVRVAHLVSRARSELLRSARADDLPRALEAAAGVVHSGLPRAIRERMPFERTLGVIRAVHQERDAWTAVVDGTSELLGWSDYARAHAASIIRGAIERRD